MNEINKQPIGVFDSGVGGLTAVKTIRKVLPNEDIIYFGDTLNAPYGTRTDEDITALSMNDVSFLRSKHVKAILIACGTITSVCLGELSMQNPDLQILGVVKKSSLKALESTKNNRICTLATPATTRKHAYSKYMKLFRPNLETLDLACPKFVPLIEANKVTINDKEMVETIHEYFAEVKKFNPDTIILGCTHFPLIKALLEKLYPEYTYICAGDDAVYELKETLEKESLNNDQNHIGAITYYSSGDLNKFGEVAKSFLGIDVSSSLHQK